MSPHVALKPLGFMFGRVTEGAGQLLIVSLGQRHAFRAAQSLRERLLNIHTGYAKNTQNCIDLAGRAR